MSNVSEPRVYVVDDDAVVRQFMSLMFTEAGLESKTFESAEDFMQQFSKSMHGCLLLDERMGGVSGMQLLQRLAAQGSDLPVIMVTGFGHIPMSVEAVKLGAVNFFEKPFDSEELVDAVREAFALSEKRQANRSRLNLLEETLSPLTPSEREVLDGLVAGQGHKDIARQLGLSLRSIEYRKSSICSKTGTSTRAELVAIMREYDELQSKCQPVRRLA